jgi:hypothetical protein
MCSEDVAAIQRLKYAYFRCLDLKHWDEFATLFVPEATGSYGKDLEFGSRDELVGYMSSTLTADMITLHQAHHPEIEVDGDPGDTATGVWYLHDKVFVPAFDYALEGAAFYSDRYVRTPDGWKIAHTGYKRTFEASWRMSAAEGWKFEVGQAY